MAKETQADKIKSLEDEIANLKLALGRLGTLTGNPKHLLEYGIKQWTPGKEHLTKHSD